MGYLTVEKGGRDKKFRKGGKSSTHIPARPVIPILPENSIYIPIVLIPAAATIT